MASILRLALFLFLLLLALPVPGFAAGTEPASPLDRPAPAYPDSAGTAQGRVVVHFAIDTQGQVRDATVKESAPSGLFDGAALDAVRNWRYQPRRVDGRAVEQPDNLVALVFKPAPLDPAHEPVVVRAATYYYPRDAYLAGQEGDVIVRFDIDENGFAHNAKVVKTPVPDVFDENALEAIKDARFMAPMVDGAPMAAAGLEIKVEFRLATARIKPKRIDHTTPVYPPKESWKGQPGYCAVSVSIAEDGTVDDAEVTDTAPGDEFRKSCLDFARHVRFEPPGEDPTGRVARQHSFTIRYIFPLIQQLLHEGEWVRVRYTLGADGEIKDPEVVAASAPDLDTAAVLKNLKLHRLKPIVENGAPVEKPGRLMIVSGDPF
jgi:TonB family protein